ncbi:MAG TPA: FHA domain-containing protein [Solirubrobacteraceae bacterium]|jgi:pSer/pThr/pTyr-binding forkhead associated (FHA) protein
MPVVEHTEHQLKTSAIDVRPHGDDERAAAIESLPRGRYLLMKGSHAFELKSDVTHIGRGLSNDVRLDDHTVSARHAIIVARAAGLRIMDDRSTNGTIVNGRRADMAELHDGDVVVLGRVVLTYRDLRAA